MRHLAFFVRHGTTDLNQVNRFRGNMDVPLDAHGMNDARRLGKFFKGVAIPLIYHSDTKRATKTAEEIDQEQVLDRVLLPTPELRSWDFGILSGQKKTKANLDKLQGFIDNPNRRIPDGESLNQFRARVHPAFRKLIALGREDHGPVLAVTHSSVIHELGNFINGDPSTAIVHPGGVVVVSEHKGELKARPLLKPDGKEGLKQ